MFVRTRARGIGLRVRRSSTILVLALLAAFALGTTSGCTRYTPHPVDVATIARTPSPYNPAAVDAEVARLTPQLSRDPAHWDMLRLVAAALLYNPNIAAARAAIASAEANARAARAPAGPTLTLSSEYAGAATEVSPWLFGAGLSVPLDIGGQRRARIDGAALAVRVARYDYADAVWKARMAIRRALDAHRLNENRIALLEPELALRQRQFAAVERRVRAGESVHSDLERVRADLADTQRRLDEARGQSSATRTALAGATGLSETIIAEIAPHLDDGPVVEPIATLADDRRIAALLSRADVLRAVATYDGSENDLRSEVGKQYPALSIGPGYTWERGLVKLPFSIGLALPQLDLNRRAILAAEARRVEAGKRLEAAIVDAQGEIDGALLEVETARAALASVQRNDLVAARRLARAADAEIGAGAIDRVDWAAAQAGLAAAQLAERDAQARVRAADAALENALRRPLAGPELAIGQAGALQ
jgi:outer membrane protein TolC